MSEEIRYASPESQYEGTGPLPEDTEEMFWLKMEDDYASRLKYGNLLAGQYRYREAVGAYRKAERIRREDPALYLRLGERCSPCSGSKSRRMPIAGHRSSGCLTRRRPSIPAHGII